VKSEVQIVFPASAVQQHVKDSSTNSFLLCFLDAFQQGATATLLLSLEFFANWGSGMLLRLFLFFNAWHTDGGRQGKARAKNVLFSTKFSSEAWRGVC
jgi:hypothetical protein